LTLKSRNEDIQESNLEWPETGLDAVIRQFAKQQSKSYRCRKKRSAFYLAKADEGKTRSPKARLKLMRRKRALDHGLAAAKRHAQIHQILQRDSYARAIRRGGRNRGE
jgi:hypothetical protein